MTKIETTDSLARAIEQLGAVEVPGHPGFYALDRQPDGWIVIRRRGCFCGMGPGLEDQLEVFAGFPPSDEILSPVLTHAVEMKPWWSPQQQYAIRQGSQLFSGYESLEEARSEYDPECDVLITCDLTTGEEVEA